MEGSTKFTKGPWRVGTHGPNGCYTIGTKMGLMTAMVAHSVNYPEQQEEATHNAILIASAPEMFDAMIRAADALWEYTKEVKLDQTMMFGPGYDWDAWDNREELHTKGGSFAVWGCAGYYYAYGGPDGSFWNGLKSKKEAKNSVLRHVAKFQPDHPSVMAYQIEQRFEGGVKWEN